MDKHPDILSKEAKRISTSIKNIKEVNCGLE
jgi:hypothetical protein